MLKMSRILLSIIGLILTIDCLALILFGKLNFGSLVPLLIGIIFIIHGVYWHTIRKFIAKSAWLSRTWYMIWGLFTLWILSFIGFVGVLQHKIAQSRHPLPDLVSAVIVLGSGTVEGKPSLTLAKRLDTAAPIIKAHPEAITVTSGGIGFGHSRSEADIMATYLHDTHAIPLKQVIQEGRSTSTEENLAYTQPLLVKRGVSVNDPIVIVTSDFHIIRTEAIAQHQGYTHAILIPSPTPLYIRYNAWFREYFAFISGWLLNEY